MNHFLIILIATTSLMLGTSDAGTVTNVEDSGPGSLRQAFDSVISIRASHLVIENSTFARNRVATAIEASRLHLRNSTISDNPNGIEMRGSEGALTLENSIVAGNSQSNLDIGLNKVEYLGTNIIDQEPILAPLGDYGGLTLTMPPLAGSPAIDAGVWTEESPSTDQRGFARLSASPLDVGAVELRSGISISWSTGDSSPTISWEPSLMDTPGGKWTLRRSRDLVNWQFWGGDLTTQNSVSFSDSGDEEFYSLIFLPE